MLLRQVVDHLIGNAVRYVAPGVRPELEVDARRTDADVGPMAELVVSDDGDRGGTTMTVSFPAARLADGPNDPPAPSQEQ